MHAAPGLCEQPSYRSRRQSQECPSFSSPLTKISTKAADKGAKTPVLRQALARWLRPIVLPHPSPPPSPLEDDKKRPKLAFQPLRKIWRQPTLAEPIEPLPSARLCLTAVFGMGTGGTTALWPPKKRFKFQILNLKFQRACSLKTTHRDSKAIMFASLNRFS